MSDGVEGLKEETRVRLGAKQTAKGYIQMDVTAEAPTVDKAGELLGGGIDRLKEKMTERGLKTVDEA